MGKVANEVLVLLLRRKYMWHIQVYNGALAGQSVKIPVPVNITISQLLKKCNQDAKIRTALKIESGKVFQKVQFSGAELLDAQKVSEVLRNGAAIHLVKLTVGGWVASRNLCKVSQQ